MSRPQEGDCKNFVLNKTSFFWLRMLQSSGSVINIGCVDPLGRTALLMAIDNENMEMVELLLENKVKQDLVIKGTLSR